MSTQANNEESSTSLRSRAGLANHGYLSKFEHLSNTMSNDLDPTDFDAVIGYYNIGSLDRQQEIWDRAITPEHFADMTRVAAFKGWSRPASGTLARPASRL